VRAVRGAGDLLGKVPKALAIVLVAAIVLRLALWAVYRPAVMNFADTGVYLAMADGEMFIDPVRPAGYSMFLAGIHALSSELALTIVLQHVLGILTGLVLYAAVRRLGAPIWAAVVSAAAVLLSLDQVFFEHTLMAEPLFTFGVAVALYACVRTLDDPRALVGPLTNRQMWIVVAGLSLGSATWVRVAGAPMIPFLVLWLALAIPGPPLARLGRALLGGAAASVAVLAYFTLHSQSEYSYFGFTEASGRVLYARVAPFADCTKFDPPAGTSKLCETTPPEQRPGPDAYLWGENVVFEEFGYAPGGDDQLAAFAREAIIHQPGDYFLSVLNDTVRHLVPGFHDRFLVADYGFFEIRRRDPALEQELLTWHNSYYQDETLHIDETGTVILSDLQQALRVPPVLMLQGLLLGALGAVFGRGRVRSGLLLFIGCGILTILVPSATATWTARYAIPANGVFVAAWAVGVWVVGRRLLDRGFGSRASRDLARAEG
jgi:hypothetical protein